MTHEIYHKGIAHKIPCYFREWTKCPNFMYQTMKAGFLSTQGKQKEDKFITNGDSALPIGDYFVMNSHTIKGEATIRKEDGIRDYTLSRGLGDVYKRQLVIYFVCHCAINCDQYIWQWVISIVSITSIYPVSYTHLTLPTTSMV